MGGLFYIVSFIKYCFLRIAVTAEVFQLLGRKSYDFISSVF